MKSVQENRYRFVQVGFVVVCVTLMTYTAIYIWASDTTVVSSIPARVKDSVIVPMIQRLTDANKTMTETSMPGDTTEEPPDEAGTDDMTGEEGADDEPFEECSVFSPWNKNLIDPETSTKLSGWNFAHRVRCPYIHLDTYPKQRRKVTLDCSSSPPTIKYTWTISVGDLHTVPFGDKCLEAVIDNCCTDNMAVPNVLHYIWYKKVEFSYFHFLSYMSALRFMRPCLYLIHGNYVPYGKYWNFFVSISPNIIHVKRDRLLSVHGHNFSFHEHSGDVMRIEAIQKYGGLYLDWDQILLRPVNNLRQYNCTMGQVFKTTFGNQVIFGRKNATFLKLWHDSYKDYKKKNWGHNSLVRPFQIAKANPSLIHIEGFNFTRPHGGNIGLIFFKNYDWSTNYAMHLYIRFYKKPIDLKIIRTLNATMGSVARHIFFGNKDLCIK